MKWAALIVAAVCLVGCAPDDTVDARVDEAREVVPRDAALGASYRLSIDEATPHHVFRVPVAAGETFATVMRATDGELDSYLALYPGDRGERIAESDYDQAVLPMARESDAVIVHRAKVDGTFLVFAADLDLEGAGDAQIDLVRLEGDGGKASLTETDPGMRAVMERLRELEPALADALAEGHLVEADDGYVEVALIDVPLSERAEMNRLAAGVNDARELLFDMLAEQGATAQLCTELWRALRSDAHRLR